SSRVVRWKHLPTYLEASQTPLPMQSNMALTTPATNTGSLTSPSGALTLHLDILTGLLSRHFEKTRIPILLPRILPDDWKGGFCLLVIVFVLSSFLDNIAAAMIGGAMAHVLFRAKVHIGYLAAIVAASNAGGAGSVVGDTTTTMMWIAGVSPFDVLHAYVAAGAALVVCGIPAA